MENYIVISRYREAGLGCGCSMAEVMIPPPITNNEEDE